MATPPSAALKSWLEHRKRMEPIEARKPWLAPVEVDEDGKDIIPRIPNAPWYFYPNRPDLEHQRKFKSDTNYRELWNDRRAKLFENNIYRKAFEVYYEEQGDSWLNVYNVPSYAFVIDTHESSDESRNKSPKDQQLEEKNNTENVVEEKVCPDEAKVDESKQMDFAKVEKRVRTTGGGSTATERILRIRETAKYILNLDVNSAHYDPKIRSICEDPLPDMDPNEKFYADDNQNRVSGQALEFKQLNTHPWESFEKGNDMHMQTAPSQAELLFKKFKVDKDKLKSVVKNTIIEKYGNAATEEVLPRDLLLGQSEREVEYDRAGRIVKGQEVTHPKSEYEEDVYSNNHTTVWASWWKDHQWGYKCCKQFVRNSYCTGAAGIEAAEAAADLMRSNIVRKEGAEDVIAPTEEKRFATWGRDIPDDLQEKLAEALKKEDKRMREEKDERKRKYNVKWNDNVTAEDMEAYRMKRVYPMKDFLK